MYESTPEIRTVVLVKNTKLALPPGTPCESAEAAPDRSGRASKGRHVQLKAHREVDLNSS